MWFFFFNLYVKSLYFYLFVDKVMIIWINNASRINRGSGQFDMGDNGESDCSFGLYICMYLSSL